MVRARKSKVTRAAGERVHVVMRQKRRRELLQLFDRREASEDRLAKNRSEWNTLPVTTVKTKFWPLLLSQWPAAARGH